MVDPFTIEEWGEGSGCVGATLRQFFFLRWNISWSIAMPSKEEKCVLSASNSTTTQDFLARDMEELVSEIKENLRLSAGLKSRPSFSVHHKSRASPYRVPSRSWGDSSCDGCLRSPSNSCGGHSCITVNKKLSSKSSDPTTASDDPYEMLQELLRDGSLIKEAVRRLQRGLSPKQRYFYDSDEETRSPLRMCHVELWITRQKKDIIVPSEVCSSARCNGHHVRDKEGLLWRQALC